MSKKKSKAWSRKTSGHISTGVVNYKNIVQFGQGTGRGSTRRRFRLSRYRDTDDIRRQSNEAHIDFNLVRVLLDYSGLTLDEAKREAVRLQGELLCRK
jgi:hypothetical protein